MGEERLGAWEDLSPGTGRKQWSTVPQDELQEGGGGVQGRKYLEPGRLEGPVRSPRGVV